MFYCEPCGKHNGWPVDPFIPQSRGTCEECRNANQICFDMPSAALRKIKQAKGSKMTSTSVVFRMDRDFGINAVFPTLPGNLDPTTCLSYALIGQHSACCRAWYDKTRPAKPEEYKDLMEHLKGQGYEDLVVYKEWTPTHDKIRAENIRADNAAARKAVNSR